MLIGQSIELMGKEPCSTAVPTAITATKMAKKIFMAEWFLNDLNHDQNQSRVEMEQLLRM